MIDRWKMKLVHFKYNKQILRYDKQSINFHLWSMLDLHNSKPGPTSGFKLFVS
jgi:hypothetical protein